MEKRPDKTDVIRHNIDMNVKTYSKVFTVEEAAQFLNISRSFLYKLFDSRKLQSFHSGKRRFVSLKALLDYIQQQEIEETDYGR